DAFSSFLRFTKHCIQDRLATQSLGVCEKVDSGKTAIEQFYQSYVFRIKSFQAFCLIVLTKASADGSVCGGLADGSVCGGSATCLAWVFFRANQAKPARPAKPASARRVAAVSSFCLSFDCSPGLTGS